LAQSETDSPEVLSPEGGGAGPSPQPLVAPSKGPPKAILVVLIVIIVILAAALGVAVWRLTPAPPPPLGALGLQPAASAASQGRPVRFTIQNLQPGARAVVSMGDGTEIDTTAATVDYTYNTPGTYLVWVREYGSDGSLLAATSSSLQRVVVTPSVSPSLFRELSLPTIYFNTTRNAQGPIVLTNSLLYLYGNFTQITQLFSGVIGSGTDLAANISFESSASVAVDRYVWDFGNGQGLTVAADPSTSYPTSNPVTVTYSAVGLYSVTLTLVTANTTTLRITNLISNVTTTSTTKTAEYSFSVGTTIAVGTASAPFDLYKFRGKVPSPGVITEIVNARGGPFSFDPQIDYETVGFEVIVNTQMTLVFYNGASTTAFLPYAAEYLPTVANGGIRDNFRNYTFHVRSGLRFSNGDPLTAYDVWYSTIRAMLFQGGAPGTADWIVSKYLVPSPIFSPFVQIMTGPNNVNEFNAIMNGISYSNATNNVTFHLVASTPPSLFFTAIDFPLGSGILDAAWLKSIGAGITFTPHGFYDYQNQSLEGNYNQRVQLQPVASGPYQINTYLPGQTVVLTPNPNFLGFPSIPKQNNTVIIEWVASPAIAYQLFTSGEGDIVTLLPPPYFKQLNQSLVPVNQAMCRGSDVCIYGPVPSITEFFFPFNVQVNLTALARLGSGYTIPFDYFANPYVRKAFAATLNYTNYVSRILGNDVYGFNFGSSYCGVIVKGLPYHPAPGNLTGCPTYDLNLAKQYLYLSGLYNTSVNFPVVIPTGDTTDFTAAFAWSQALKFIDANIVMTPVYLDFSTIIGNLVPGQDGMPLYSLGWIADYPHPSDYTDAMYLEGGTYPAPDGWDPAYLAGLAANHTAQSALFTGQAQNYTALNNLIRQADALSDPVTAAARYQQVEQAAVNLYMYVYTYQPNLFWIVKPYIQPYGGDWGYQSNPTIGAAGDSIFWWWVKG
jgi:peptide/nickel transport system substrate-binding protein